MTDPVMRDLDRHLARIDDEEAVLEHGRRLRDEDPDTYGEMDDDELHDAALEDIKAEAECRAEAQWEDYHYEPPLGRSF